VVKISAGTLIGHATIETKLPATETAPAVWKSRNAPPVAPAGMSESVEKVALKSPLEVAANLGIETRLSLPKAVSGKSLVDSAIQNAPPVVNGVAGVRRGIYFIENTYCSIGFTSNTQEAA
jgi:hypothetical protein